MNNARKICLKIDEQLNVNCFSEEETIDEILKIAKANDLPAEEASEYITSHIVDSIISFTGNKEEISDIVEEVLGVLNFKTIAKYLQENIEGLYFGVECKCTLGDTYLHKGDSYRFYMWRGLIITDSNVLSIIPHTNDSFYEKTIHKVFELLETEIFHVGIDEFDNFTESYEIIRIKGK